MAPLVDLCTALENCTVQFTVSAYSLSIHYVFNYDTQIELVVA